MRRNRIGRDRKWNWTGRDSENRTGRDRKWNWTGRDSEVEQDWEGQEVE